MDIIELVNFIKQSYHYLISKWKTIVVVGLVGGLIGFSLSFIIKPKYTAKLSFSLVDSSTTGITDLASNLGFSALLGNNNNVFSGDNLLEIIKSKYAVEHTLLSPVIFQGEEKTLIEAYIDYNHLRKKWSRSRKPELRDLTFPVGSNIDDLTRTQDSIIAVLYKRYTKKNELRVIRVSKKVGMTDVLFTSKNEEFSKLFIEKLMDQTFRFYKETKTSQTADNLAQMQHTADSIKNLYETALAQSSTFAGVNVNKAMQAAMVPKLKQEYDAQLYGTVYAEVLKNLETLKMDLNRETPIIQIIDKPRYPLKKDKLGKIKGIALGGLFAGFLIVIYLLIIYWFDKLKQTHTDNK